MTGVLLSVLATCWECFKCLGRKPKHRSGISLSILVSFCIVYTKELIRSRFCLPGPLGFWMAPPTARMGLYPVICSPVASSGRESTDAPSGVWCHPRHGVTLGTVAHSNQAVSQDSLTVEWIQKYIMGRIVTF